jgi:putative membrane protein
VTGLVLHLVTRGRIGALLVVAGAAAAVGLLLLPLAASDNGSLAVHMAEHLVLLDLAPVLVLLGLVLSGRGATRLPAPSRAAAVAALAISLGLFGLWHAPAAFDTAAVHPALHAAEHLSLLAAGALAWGPLLGSRWTGRLDPFAALAFVGAVRLAQAVLGNVLLWSPGPLYTPYDDGPAALDDQRLAAALMMGEGTLVSVAVVVWLLARLMDGATAVPRSAR